MAERTNPHANLIIGAQDEASPVFDKIKASSQSMAAGVEQAATKAAGAVGVIGDKAAPAAQKLDGITASMIRQVQRLNAELEAGGARNAAYIEKMASIKGADLSAMAPYLADLKKAEAAQRVATTGLDHMGMSAKQTTATLRQVPMQFTDIVVSLQGGQSAMQVFLQQGGQLKDMFGGAGNAARALGGYVLGLVNPFTIAAAAVAGIAVAYNQGSKEADAYRLAMVGTGNAAGTTAGQLKSYAQEISGVVGTQGKAAESLAAFVSTGRVSRDVLKEASQAAIAWERATGQAVSTTAKQFADLGKDPLQAVLKLNEGTNFLTESVYRQIKSLDEQGRTAEAAAVAQRAYADALTGRSATITQNLGYIEAAWKGITNAAKKSWDAMLNVGRASTPADATAELRTRLMRQQEELAAKKAINPYADTRGMEKGIEILKQRLGLLESDERQTRRLAEAEAERAKQMQATAAWDKEGAKYLTDKAKLERDLTVARNEGLAAGKSQAEIEKRLAQIRESYAKKGGRGGIAAENKDLRDQQRIFAELADVSSTYYADLATAQQQRAKGNLSEAQYVKYVEELIQKQPFAVAGEKARAEAIKESAKAAAESSKALGAWYEVREKESQGLQNQINARREEVSMMGMTTEAVVAYTQAKYEQQAAEKEAYAAALESASFYAGEYAEAYKTAAEAARQQAAQLRELGGLEVEKANKDAAKKAAQEWERAADDINRSLTDALLRGFESGKDFAKNLRDTVVNMFKTMVLRPVISAVVNPIAGAVTGMMGLSGAANAGTSALGAIGSAASGASFLGNAAGLLGGAGTAAGYGFSALMSGNGLGALSGGLGMLTSGGPAAIMAQGAGMIAGVLGPIALGIGAVVSLVKKLDDSGTMHTGALSQYSAAGGLANSTTHGAFGMGFGGVDYSAETEKFTGAMAQSIVQMLDSTATTFGKEAGYKAATAFADDTSKDGAWGGLLISKLEETIVNWDPTRTSKWAPKEFADGAAGKEQYLAAVAADVRVALESIGLPAWATGMLDQLGQGASIEQLAGAVDQINAAKAAFAGFAQYMPIFAGLADTAISKLVDASGGVGALAGNMGAFVDGFYRDSEKLAINTQNVTDALAQLGFEMPATRDEFKALVQSQIALGDAGAQTTAGLLAVSGAVSAVLPPFEDAAAGIGTVSDAMRRLQSDTASLQIDLLRAQGNTTGADAAQRTLDTAGLTAAEVAVYDYNQALRAQITALDAAATAAAQQAEIRAGFERQLLELSGDTAALRLLDIAGMDAANVALYDRVQALQASVAAESERAGLLDRWDAAVGDSVRLRDRERNAIAQANRALWDQVTAMEALRNATQANAAGKDTFDKTYTTTQEQRDALQAVINDTFAGLKIEAPESVSSYKALESYFDNLAKQAKFAFEALGSSRETAISLINTGKAVDEKGVLQDYAYWDKRITEMTGVTQRPTSVTELDALIAELGKTANDAAGDYAAVLKASEAYAVLNKIVNGVPESAGNAADAVGKLSDALAQQKEDMLGRIFELENAGNTSALQGRELGKLDPTLRPLQERIWALEREAVVMGEQKSILEQINQLTMTSEQLRKLERNALDESNRAMFDRLTGLQEAKRIDDERKELQNQLNALTDTAAEALARQRDALDESNRAMFDQIQAVTKAKEIEKERAGLQDQINQLTMTSAELRNLERNALDESNRALFDRITGLQAAAAVEQERAGLQDELNRIVMSEDQLLALRRETLAESNRALFDQIQVATREKALEAERARAAEEARQAAAARAQQVAQERAGLQDRINGLTLGTAALRDLEVSKLDASNQSLLRRIFVLEDEKRVADERTALQEQINQLTLSTVELRALEIAKLDASNRPMQERIWLLEEEKRVAEERNNLMTSLYQATGNTGALRAEQLADLDLSNRALQDQIWQIEDAKTALGKALQAEQETASAAQQAAQERVSTIKSIFDTLKTNVDDLYKSVTQSRDWGAQQANAFIDNALANAKTTGYLPEFDDLASAISAARAGLDTQYATEFDRQRAQLVLAGKLAELQAIAGPQMTAAEQQLKAAEDQVKALDGLQEQGRAMLDRLSGNVTATLSVRDAIDQLSGALTSAGVTDFLPSAPPANTGGEITVPPVVWNPSATGGAMGSGNTARLESLVEGLTLQVQSLQTELAAIRGNTGQLAEQFDNVTGGGNDMRTRSVKATA